LFIHVQLLWLLLLAYNQVHQDCNITSCCHLQGALEKIATLSQLTRLQLHASDALESSHLSALSSLSHLQWFTVECTTLDVVHTCVPAWQQLQVLELRQDRLLDWADLQMLASLPHLHSLKCSGFDLRGEGQACLSALRSLSFSTCSGLGTCLASPAQLLALSLPSLESVSGVLDVQLYGLDYDDEDIQDQMLGDLRQAAAGILQWGPQVSLALRGTLDNSIKIMQALASWRPVQRGHMCHMGLWRTTKASNLAALPHVPFAVQDL
jgi:hypothetical protein